MLKKRDDPKTKRNTATKKLWKIMQNEACASIQQVVTIMHTSFRAEWGWGCSLISNVFLNEKCLIPNNITQKKASFIEWSLSGLMSMTSMQNCSQHQQCTSFIKNALTVFYFKLKWPWDVFIVANLASFIDNIDKLLANLHIWSGIKSTFLTQHYLSGPGNGSSSTLTYDCKVLVCEILFQSLMISAFTIGIFSN